LSQPICAHAFENNVISVQGFQMNSRWQCWMHTLSQSLFEHEREKNVIKAKLFQEATFFIINFTYLK
jgi:hypothetical protein